MIPIDLLRKCGSYEFVTIIEVSNMRRCSGKANKFRYIYVYIHHKRDVEGHRHQGTEINNIKIKIIPFIIYIFEKLYHYESIS